MRSDYLLYILAILFFIAAAASAALVVEFGERILWITITIVLGIISLSFGYYYGPRVKTLTTEIPKIEPTSEVADTHVREAHLAESVEKHAESTDTPVSTTPIPMQDIAPVSLPTPVAPTEPAIPVENALTEVKGIGPKRAAQLKAQGINTVDDLARASPEKLANSLAISPKITQKWVNGAKDLQKETK
jgi:predicted flap endonuclease-1-like 5' DNA nuclease